MYIYDYENSPSKLTKIVSKIVSKFVTSKLDIPQMQKQIDNNQIKVKELTKKFSVPYEELHFDIQPRYSIIPENTDLILKEKIEFSLALAPMNQSNQKILGEIDKLQDIAYKCFKKTN